MIVPINQKFSMNIPWYIIGILLMSPNLPDFTRTGAPLGINAQDQAGIESPFCDFHHVCEGSDGTRADYHDGQCFCDDRCSYYNDCCHGNSQEVGTDVHVNELVTASVCERFGNQSMYVVKSCPADYPVGDVSSYCEGDPTSEDLLQRLPVTEARYGVTFKNIYCAVCHEYSTRDVIFWTMEVECLLRKIKKKKKMKSNTKDRYDIMPSSTGNNTSNATYYDVTKTCLGYKYNFFKPENIPPLRRCLPKLTSTCMDTWQNNTVLSQCEQGAQATVYLGLFAYKNIYCAMCNGVNANDGLCNQAPDIDEILRREEERKKPPHLISVSVLLDFNSRSVTVHDRSLNLDKSCDPDSVYDITTDSCRKVVCRPGLILRDGQCTPTSNSTARNISPNKHANSSIDDEPPCTYMKVDDQTFHVHSNNTLYFNESRDNYESQSYMISNHTVYICQKDHIGRLNMHNKHTDLNQDIVSGILSLVGHIISILSLLVLIFFYSWIKTLRTLPGKCLLCLACSLAAAQLAFIIGTFTIGVHVVCEVIGILTHFGYLLAFFWMNVMAFDVYITFRNRFATASSSGKKFISYVLYALLLPMCIVGVAVLSDNTNIDMPKPSYGRPYCWIGQSKALLYYFVIPIGTLLLFNFILFSLAVYHICQSFAQDQFDKNPHSNRKRLLLYVKLSTIMGLTWIFGYIALINGSHVLWYLFIIFNTLQGLFICLAFLCNRKVSTLFRQKLGLAKSRSPTPSSALTRNTVLDARTSPDVRRLTQTLIDKDKQNSPEAREFTQPITDKNTRASRVSSHNDVKQVFL